MILVEPFHALLGLIARKAIFHERFAPHIELAHHDRIGAASREADHALLKIRPQTCAAFVDPVLAFRFRKGVNVE